MRTFLNHTIIIFLFVGCFFSTSLKAQDPIYSQFYNAPLEINPAFAGLSSNPILYANYRNQWSGIPNAFNTFSAAYSQAFPEYNSGLGVRLSSDTAGDGLVQTFTGAAAYSYNLKVKSDFFIKFGLEGALVQNRLQGLCFGEQIEQSGLPCDDLITIGTGSGETGDFTNNKTYFDISMGLLAYSEQYYGGISISHLNAPDNNFLDDDNIFPGIPVRISLIAGMRYEFQETYRRTFAPFISPNILLVKQGDLVQLNAGTLVGFKTIFLGGWYRHAFSNPDALIISVGASKGPLKISYSYDVTISDLSLSNTGGSHEIGVVLNFGSKKGDRQNVEDCFSIFR